MTNQINFIKNQYSYMCDYNQVINAPIKDTFLKYADNQKITIQDVDIDEETIKKRIKTLPHLIFEVSEKCNLRCKYCVYGGIYFNRRGFSQHNMCFETAKKGMDYVYSFISHRKKKEFTLGFYGGEPLLNFETIKEIIKYGKKLFSGWKLRFNMTTNLTLLNDRMLDYLIKNNFSLLVSLDGDKNNHDSKRVFANGKGSHYTVMKNLKRIKKRDNKYFDRKVSLSAVYSFELPLKNMYKFFTSNQLINRKQMRFSTVNSYDTTYYERYDFNKNEFQKNFKFVLSKLLRKLRDEEGLTGFESFLYNDFKRIDTTLRWRTYTSLANTCLFDSRLYLDARGGFNICEKVNNSFSFGDVDNGFDFSKMMTIVSGFINIVKAHCADCNIRFLCKRCYVSFLGDGEFKLNPEFCKNQKEFIIRNLEKYIECKEENLA